MKHIANAIIRATNSHKETSAINPKDYRARLIGKIATDAKDRPLGKITNILFYSNNTVEAFVLNDDYEVTGRAELVMDLVGKSKIKGEYVRIIGA